MDSNKIEDLSNKTIFIVLVAGMFGPFYIWYRTTENSHNLVTAVALIIYCGIEVFWLTLGWMIWVPVTVIGGTLLIYLDIRWTVEAKKERMDL